MAILAEKIVNMQTFQILSERCEFIRALKNEL